jgi:hypothetical protein
MVVLTALISHNATIAAAATTTTAAPDEAVGTGETAAGSSCHRIFI